jgi:hypothetical protein
MKGYKIFKPDFTAKEGSFQYAENKTFEMDLPIKICSRGFHFCVKLAHCFSYYDFDHNNIVCEVEALGDIMAHEEDSKICTNKLHVGRRLSWQDVLTLANEGKNNTGHSNTGNRNTGYRNTGNRNTGYSNTGDWNTGNSNTGDWNTGNSNTGNRNTGDWNTGDRNTGDRNTGNRNTGDWNTGNRNTGYSNTGNRNTGAFCTGEKTMKFFNKDSDWTEEKFKESKVYNLLCNVNTKMWIYPNSMTEEEKQKYPSYKTCDGYLKDIPFKEAFQNQWHNWSEENRNAFKILPNFDAIIFEEITGVKV